MSGAKSKVRGLAIEINREDALDLKYRGKPTFIRNATYCETVPGKESLELNCEWSFEGNEREAKTLFSAYRIQIKECLGVPFEPRDAEGYGKVTILSSYKAEIEHSDGSETSIELELQEKNYSSTPEYAVDLDIERD
ncbi:hypothetical protein [Erythrobacter crassostreae]|uniref:Uncharacterized protein n=1 Tax=Erythrobacter crassostreae TaxID=2828328 RepID=A0A9X1F2B4_9SPHN|nr:hypothetical protein [Erythrobacter crassostrea]MBV7258839.1 hypothetical protein [Erythrobacter crassostrea]